MAEQSSGRTKQNMKETDNIDDDDGSSAGEEEEDDYYDGNEPNAEEEEEDSDGKERNNQQAVDARLQESKFVDDNDNGIMMYG